MPKAMHLLQANVNLVYIRDLLGHESVTTTEVYARADNTLKRKALEKADPIKHQKLDIPDWNDDEGLMDWLRNNFCISKASYYTKNAIN